jgi:hypothetical protein
VHGAYRRVLPGGIEFQGGWSSGRILIAAAGVASHRQDP